MKKIYCLLLLPILLSGCALIYSQSETDGSSHSEKISESIVDESVESESSQNDSTPDVDYPYLDNNRLLLNPYGDYVLTDKEPSDLLDTFNKLSKKETSEVNGVLQSSYEKGLLEFFNSKNKVDIKINLSHEIMEQLDHDYYTNNRESFRMCSVDISFLDLTFHYEEVGIRQKGNTSRGPIIDGNRYYSRHYKLSFEETFDDEYIGNQKEWKDQAAYDYRKDRSFFGLSKIDFRWNRNKDQTYMREYYAFEMYRGNGGLAPRSNPVHFMINIDHEDYNFGVYLAVETITKSFIKRNFIKSSRDGNLYKLSWGSGQGAKFNPVNDNFFGVETQYKDNGYFKQNSYTYDLKTNKEDTAHTAIKTFISVLNEQHGNTAYDFATEYLDYDLFITYLAVSYLLGDPDDLRSNDNNAYVYFLGGSNKMVIIPIDNDRVLGASGGAGGNPTGHHGAFSKPFDKNTGYGGDNNSNLFNKLLFSTNSTIIRPEYINRIDEIANNSGWMDLTIFNDYLWDIMANYHECVQIHDSVNGCNLLFDNNESNDVYGEENLSVGNYMDHKVNTFNDNKN